MSKKVNNKRENSDRFPCRCFQLMMFVYTGGILGLQCRPLLYTCPLMDMWGHGFKKFFENFIFYIFRIRNSAVRTVWSTLNSNCNEYGENDAPRRPVTSALPLVVILMSMYPSVSQPMS